MKAIIFTLTLLSISFSEANAEGAITANCSDSDYVSTDARQVTISVQGMSYSPRCLRVKAGTEVTIQADARHPLVGEKGSEGAPNPFEGTSEANVTKLLSRAGTYGYFCERHVRMGMAGAIQVVP